MKKYCIGMLFLGSTLLAQLNINDPLTIMEFIEENRSFQVLKNLLIETRVDSVVSKEGLVGRYTLFAPTDQAFNQFGRLGLLRGEGEKDKERYKEFINFHLVRESFSRKELAAQGKALKTLAGESIKLEDIGRIKYSIDLKNGIIHVIDHVLINPEIKEFLFKKE